ncbi:Cytochrome P450 [Canna indica]|uniref:Cytochrome P450 n=1 Tax=Canna indica TaxID=4628 RepID=A0AAQ3Q810_9LILI|nr:Cytochrome P450 [Canna indica]
MILGLRLPLIDESCVVWADALEWVTYGSCGHREVCSTCVVHLRFVLDDRRCCICKNECPVVFVTKVALMSALKQIAGIEAGPASEALKTKIFKLVLGTLSLPINFPGTNCHQGLKARRKVVSMLQYIINQRIISTCSYNDMLDSLLKIDDKSKAKLDDKQIIDLIIALVYSGYETVSKTSMMVIKYLHDHPKILEEVRHEHLWIQKSKLHGDAINWNNYKSMKFTRAVILETLRMATVVNGVLRKTTKDVEVNDYARQPEAISFNSAQSDSEVNVRETVAVMLSD